MHVLAAGGTGFIGRRFCEAVLEGSLPGIAALRVAARDTAGAADLAAAGAEVMACDLADPAQALKAAEGMDAVLHCAGRSGLGGPLRLYQVNIDVTRSLLSAARATGAGRFIHIGSPSMYFDRTNALARGEDYLPARLPDGYTKSKAIADDMVLGANGAGLTTISLRPRFATGRGDGYLLSRFIRLHRKGALRRVGAGDNLVDFTAAANLVDAIGLALAAPASAGGEAYNITNGAPVALWPFLSGVMEAVGLKPISASVPYRVAALTGLVVEGAFAFADRAPGLSRLSAAVLSHSMTMSIDKARTQLGYVPRQSNGDMVAEFAAWYRKDGA